METINLTIHYGGSMKKEGDDYKYVRPLDSKTLNWNLSDFRWEKIAEFLRSELVTTPISLVWYKPRSKEMKNIMYRLDCDNLYEMYKVGKPEGGLDLFIEHDCSESIPLCYLTSSKQEDADEDCGYDGGTESEKEDADEDCGYDDGTESEKEDADEGCGYDGGNKSEKKMQNIVMRVMMTLKGQEKKKKLKNLRMKHQERIMWLKRMCVLKKERLWRMKEKRLWPMKEERLWLRKEGAMW